MKADLTHIHELRTKAEQLKLSGYECLQHYSDYSLYEIYNGAGPERWPEFARVLLTEILDLFEPAFLLHDVGFNESKGERSKWIEENRMCEENMSRIITNEYPVFAWNFAYNWLMRRRWKAKALLVSAALGSELCYEAYLEAGNHDE